ncbi:UV-stimulated scaffold protein A [Erythrolamprus reginae]|uniref:UV-stimulated scaffold protein A n=1 Tax=Erythrolamprus reginae TaxID=121349 RepID=UPI00396C732C
MQSSGAGMDQQLSQLVEDLTTSGEPQLDPKKMKALKNICRASDEHINHVYHLLMSQLNQDHAEIRLSAFQILDQLFARSHLFRTLLISNFQEFLELTVETDYDQPLPPPADVAQKLKKAAIKSVQEWHEKYGEAYKKLSLGYFFLKQNKKVDFQDVHARTIAERRRDEERQRRLDNIYKDKAQKVEKEMKDTSPEIQSVLTELESCFQLLVPDPLDFTVDEIEATDWRRGEVAQTAPWSSEQVANQQGASWDLDQQPCCSKDLPGVSPGPKTDPRDSGEETEEYHGPKGPLKPESTSLGLMGDEDPAMFLRSHGLGSYKYTLSLEVSSDVKLSENEDNAAIISNLSDSFKLIMNKYLPLVQSWIQLFTRAGISDDRLREAIDLKNRLEAALQKAKKMNIDFKEKRKRMKSPKEGEEEEEEEDEFVEVPEKEGFEPHIPHHLREEYGLEPVLPTRRNVAGTGKSKAVAMSRSLSPSVRQEEEMDPTCAAATWKMIRDKLPGLPTAEDRDCEPTTSKEANSQREEEKAKAPLVPFGLDLFYWGQEQPTPGRILKFSSQHRFWAPNEVEEEVENKEISEMLKSRYITYAGTFEPVKHRCRAPMSGGGLCQRQDRFKCPFHGKILPRDESGAPLSQEDREREAKRQFEKKEQQPEWRDPNFMREVEAATGADLGSSHFDRKAKGEKKKGKKTKKKYPNLTDLKQKANTSRSRLGKRVFNKSSVKRVVKAMNRIDQRKHEKFANQFNYALN